ncbi:MAG: DDE-type integrase/transposase/recombinase [Spirochaetales bacterium]|nr:DDE-type integrase/transposase/recombinase [Spirochaetales bacterium]
MKKVLSNRHATPPRVINTDEAPSYASAIKGLKLDKILDLEVLHRPVQFMNNILEQNHGFIKWRIRPMPGFFQMLWN